MNYQIVCYFLILGLIIAFQSHTSNHGRKLVFLKAKWKQNIKKQSIKETLTTIVNLNEDDSNEKVVVESIAQMKLYPNSDEVLQIIIENSKKATHDTDRTVDVEN